MKRTIFLIIASLLVLGLVLTGCRPLRTDDTLTIGVCGAMGYDQGLHALWGAQLAATDININKFDVGGHIITVKIVSIDTDEILNPGGAAGTLAVSAALSNCDFIVGGFRTEAVEVYREPIMSDQVIFINCGAATETLCNEVVTKYDRYKYFFRGTPMNEYLLAESQSKVLTMVLYGAGVTLAGMNKTFVPKIAILAEDAAWTRTSKANAQAKFNTLGYAVSPTTWLVSPTATDITPVLNDIAAKDPNIIYTMLSGPVGMTYGNTVGDYMPNVLSVGINVEAQRQEFGTAAKYAEGMVFLDGWAPGVDMTANTAGFLADFAAAHSDKWPIYTAATYDAVGTLVEALQSEGFIYSNKVSYNPVDIVEYLEGSVRTGTAGTTGFYPVWDETTTGTYVTYAKTYTDVPALNEGQVKALYPWLTQAKYSNGGVVSKWAYDSDDWTMAPHTTHDLIYGTEWATGIGSQWQDPGSGTLTKVCIWPKPYAAGAPYNFPTTQADWLAYLAGTPDAGKVDTAQAMGLWDKYGWWHWQYPGTGSLDLTNWINWLSI